MNEAHSITQIGGVALDALAAEYETPLYIIDEAQFEAQIECFTTNFQSQLFQTNILYASKAFTNQYTAKKVTDMGLHLDVVSGGELYTALSAGVDPNRIHFHGNNKLDRELRLAIEAGIAGIIVDNIEEIAAIEAIAAEMNKIVRTLLRINPGIDAHTHDYIKTSKENSKFGLYIDDVRTVEAIQAMQHSPQFDFRGIHAHIGSQIFDEASFFKNADAMISFAARLKGAGITIREINLGGGFGIYYTAGDTPFEMRAFLQNYIAHIESALARNDLTVETIAIEPGRSLINNSGHTLYRVGAVKQPFAGKPYILIDGGMTDNPRPSLYGAKYEATLVGKGAGEIVYDIAGRACETGDILIQDALLPQAVRGDLLLVLRTGAYNYAMSSNYNRIVRPAVVFVKDGFSKVVVKRETYEDLVRNDVQYEAEGASHE